MKNNKNLIKSNKNLLLGALSIFYANVSYAETMLKPKIIRSIENKAAITVTLPTKTSSQNLRGYELPLLDNEYEQRNKGNFKDGRIVRLITTEPIFLYRVYKGPPTNANDQLREQIILGFQGTWLTNMLFKDKKAAMAYLALLPEWYHQFGEPDMVSLILVPKGTELYVGNAGPQTGGAQIIPTPPARKLRPTFKERKEVLKQEKAQLKEERSGRAQKASDLRDYRLGGGVQILVPPKNFMGQKQLDLSHVDFSEPLK